MTLTVDENIKLFAELFGESSIFFDKVNDVINMMNLSEYRQYLVKHLSQGTRHKVYLSIMLSKSSSVLILDEPFSSVDKKTQDVIFQYIMSIQKDKIIVYVTHIEEFEKLATRTIVLEKIER